MLFRNIRLLLSVNVITLVCGVLTSLLTARGLGPSGRGELAVIALWPSVLILLADLGVGAASSYRVAKRPEAVATIFSNGFLFSLGSSFVALGLAQLLVPWLVGPQPPSVIALVRLYLFAIVLSALGAPFCSLLQGARHFGWISAVRLCAPLVHACGFLFLWLSGRLSVATATYVMIGAHSLSLLILVVGVWRNFSLRWQSDWAEWKTTFSYGLRDFPGIVGGTTSIRVDQLMLVHLTSHTFVGLYFIAARLSEITFLMSASVTEALLPEIAASAREGRALQLLTKSLRLTLYAHLCLLLPAWFAAPYLLHLLYGAEFLAATSVFRVLLVVSLLWSVSNILTTGLKGFGLPGASSIARVTSVAVTLLTMPPLFAGYGITGAALALLAGYTAAVVVAWCWLARSKPMNWWECLCLRWSDLPWPRLKKLERLPAEF